MEKSGECLLTSAFFSSAWCSFRNCTRMSSAWREAVVYSAFRVSTVGLDKVRSTRVVGEERAVMHTWV